jgi:GntR family transcriptional regulator
MIHGGEYSAGAKLPSEPELAAQLKSSRVTLREALATLEAEGLITRRRGVGTFVASRLPVVSSLHQTISSDQMIRSMGMEAGTRETRWRTIEASPEIARQLALPEKSEVVELVRIRTADDKPVLYSFDYLPGDILPDQPAMLGPSLYAFLSEVCGREIEFGEAELIPYAADEDVAKKLEVPIGTLCMHIRQVDFDVDHRPVVFSKEYYVATACKFTVRRQGPPPGGSA